MNSALKRAGNGPVNRSDVASMLIESALLVKRPSGRFRPLPCAPREFPEILRAGQCITLEYKYEARNTFRRQIADRLCISSIGLPALHVRLHIRWRHQPYVVAERYQLASSVVRRRARLHADQAGRQCRKELQHLSAPELSAHKHLPIRTDRVNLKHVLR